MAVFGSATDATLRAEGNMGQADAGMVIIGTRPGGAL